MNCMLIKTFIGFFFFFYKIMTNFACVGSGRSEDVHLSPAMQTDEVQPGVRSGESSV